MKRSISARNERAKCLYLREILREAMTSGSGDRSDGGDVCAGGGEVAVGLELVDEEDHGLSEEYVVADGDQIGQRADRTFSHRQAIRR